MQMVNTAFYTYFERLSALKIFPYLRFIIYGLFLPFSFAPFHQAGLAILSLSILFAELNFREKLRPFYAGLFYGLGFFGLGISWIYVSIHNYGHLNCFLSALITFTFLLYLSLYTALLCLSFSLLKSKNLIISALIFAALWVVFEYLRSTIFTGFPWLLLGYGQFDSPLKYLLPIIGVSGVSFVSCLIAALLAGFFRYRQFLYLLIAISLTVAPLILKKISWVTKSTTPISIAIVQANLSMRDKWDENLFWQILKSYQNHTKNLLGTDLILWPESAIPLPPAYLSEYLDELQQALEKAGSSLLTGMPLPVNSGEKLYFNSLVSMGLDLGSYHKQHLVPFGEFIPAALAKVTEILGLPDTNLKPGGKPHSLLTFRSFYVASLICYEVTYGELLRAQLPAANFIVSISDDGWFGHSLAVYQQLQMAQVRSLQAGRYQLLANNDGLSSLIDLKGNIVASLPVYQEGILKNSLYPAHGRTPWVLFGDLPIEIVSALILLFAFLNLLKLQKQRR